MRGLALALILVVSLAAARVAAAAELGVVYVRGNVGSASGGHAALVAGDTVYHLQTDGDGLYWIARGRWSHFAYVYAGLQNRPLEVAALDVDAATRGRVLDRFARLYVEQDIEARRREARASDVAWLEALEIGAPPPPLRAAGLLDRARPDDPHAARLRASLGESLAHARGAFDSEPLAIDVSDLESLRERLALREALDALEGAWSIAPEARVATPSRFDDPLTDAERASLRAFASKLEASTAELLRSRRPDRGFALLVAQARIVAIGHSLAQNRLILLDAFDGHGGAPLPPEDALGERARLEQVEYTGALLRRGREVVLETDRLDESTYNLLEESAGLLERTESGRSDSALLDLERNKLPARGRSVAAPAFDGDIAPALVAARARLAEADARYRARWSYDLIRRNCITELARTADEALAGQVPADEALGFIPFVFFDRVRERAPVADVVHVPSHRARELARLERAEPGPWMRLRESTALGSKIYKPRIQDGAFLLFTDDVYWRRPVYGAVNFAYAAGYTAYGVAAAPFDLGARAKAGFSGMFWSVPELVFQNVRKGTFEWVTAAEDSP